MGQRDHVDLGLAVRVALTRADLLEQRSRGQELRDGELAHRYDQLGL